VEDQAELTFSMGCRAVVKLYGLLHLKEYPNFPDRLPPARLVYLHRIMRRADLHLRDEDVCLERFMELRRLYEPQIFAIAKHLMLDIPPFVVESEMFEPTTPEAAVRDAET
jgi:hypothetical protein